MSISLSQHGDAAVGIQQSQRLCKSLTFPDRRDTLIIRFFKLVCGLVGAPTGEMPILAVAEQPVQAAAYSQNCHMARMQRRQWPTSHGCPRCKEDSSCLPICRRSREDVFNHI